MEYLLAVHNNLAHPLHPALEIYNADGVLVGGVKWWQKRCKSESARQQIALVGRDAHTLEEIFMKYGEEPFLFREDFFRFFFAMKNAPTFDRAAFTSQSDCSDKTFWQSVDKTGYKLGNHPKNIEPCVHRARTVRAPCDNAPEKTLTPSAEACRHMSVSK